MQPDFFFFFYVFTRFCGDKILRTIMSEITSSRRLLVISHQQTGFFFFCLFNVPLHLYSEGLIKVLSFLAVLLPTLSHIFFVLSFNTAPWVKNNNQSSLTPLFIF